MRRRLLSRNRLSRHSGEALGLILRPCHFVVDAHRERHNDVALLLRPFKELCQDLALEIEQSKVGWIALTDILYDVEMEGRVRPRLLDLKHFKEQVRSPSRLAVCLDLDDAIGTDDVDCLTLVASILCCSAM